MATTGFSEIEKNGFEDRRALHLALELSLLGLEQDDPDFGLSPEERLKRSQNMTECVPVPSSEHVAEIVGRQGCKIKALRAKTNTYIKTPVRGEEPVFVVTGRKEDVAAAKKEILSAAEHFSQIRASRRNSAVAALTQQLSPGVSTTSLVPPAPPTPVPGHVTIQVRVPYRVVGLVVGPKGATIKRIQQTTHTYIVTPSRDKEPVFEVTGLPENVETAKKEIESHIAVRTGGIFGNGLPDLTNIKSSYNDDIAAFFGNGFETSPTSLKSRNPLDVGFLNSLNKKLNAEVETSSSGLLGLASSKVSDMPSFGSLSRFGSIYGSDSDDGLGRDTPPFAPQPSIWSNDFNQSRFGFGSLLVKRSNSVGYDNELDHLPARRVSSDPLASLSSALASLANTMTDCDSAISEVGGSLSPSSSPVGSSVSPVGSSLGSSRGSLKRECVSCCESEVVAALVPCGHNLFCMSCAQHLAEEGQECPVCHVGVKTAIRIIN
ncbi:RNA-binding protein MEX3B-like [Artemia franciscana]|uniref:RING-type domain-containing protein n=1 Tax=Artemia franciscana TaxID=6661 RepID=A0AA88H7B0_ARTSF|nr:hypothetical protein QYM36_018173 [Artemia franciscana]